jgi:hypothetical protein
MLADEDCPIHRPGERGQPSPDQGLWRSPAGAHPNRRGRCPLLWAPPPLAQRELRALVARRDALVVMRTQEQNRLPVAHASVRPGIEALIAHLMPPSASSNRDNPSIPLYTAFDRDNSI